MDDDKDRQTVAGQLQEQQRAWQVCWTVIYMPCPKVGIGPVLAIQPKLEQGMIDS